ncbi:MAG: DNA primase [Bacteroidota bacterium]
MIPKETIALIFDAARIEEVVGDFVQLKRSGSNYKGLSPFVNEKTPSFYVSPAKGIFKDFSSGKGGSAVTFLMEHEKLSYPEALRYLAKKYNIEVEEEEQTAEQIAQQNERESLLLILQFAQEYFSDYLINNDEGRSIGLGYFRERGFTDAIIKKFSLGYHPEGRDHFTKAALEKGYKLEYLEKLGLTRVRDGRSFDFFHGRVMFPIQNLTGRVIGFGGRVLKADKNIAKYFNSPESELYNKSKTLYGIFQAKNRIVGEDNCYLVEGYTDVLAMHQAGIENAVASSGTSLTIEQIQMVKRFTQNITILYDGDAAGIKASFRGINMVLEAGLNVKVVLFPDGDDPDSYSKKVSGEELKEYLKSAPKDFISFKTGLLLDEVGKDPIRRAGVIKDIVESIALVPDAIMRSSYIRATSQMMDIQEQVLISELNRIRKSQSKEDSRKNYNTELPEAPPDDLFASDEPTQQTVQIDSHEKEIMRILLNYGHLNFDYQDEHGTEPVTQNVADFVIETILADEIVFENPMFQRLFELIVNEYKQNPMGLLTYSDADISGLATSLVMSEHHLSENWKEKKVIIKTEEVRLPEVVKKGLLGYLLRRVESIIHGLTNQLKEELPEASQDEIQTEIILYLQAKKTFSKELGRIVLK